MPIPPEWEPPTTPAATVEEAAERCIEAARSHRARLIAFAADREGYSLTFQFVVETQLININIAHQIVTGEELPREFRLEGSEHFNADGVQQRGRTRASR